MRLCSSSRRLGCTSPHQTPVAREGHPEGASCAGEVGLDLLHPNGTLQRDAQNNSIPTYGMEQIVNFAKVFTGFRERPFRPNIENEDDDDLIDPMIVDSQRHDVHPKPDFYGGFLGDALPSCAEPGIHKFLAKGARFEFYPVDHLGEVLEVSQGSGLYDAFCSKVGNECSFPATLVLDKTLQCAGAECAAGDVSIVKVDGRHYIFIPPPCVYSYFKAVPFNASVGLFALWPSTAPTTAIPTPAQKPGIPRAVLTEGAACTSTRTPWAELSGATTDPFASHICLSTRMARPAQTVSRPTALQSNGQGQCPPAECSS